MMPALDDASPAITMPSGPATREPGLPGSAWREAPDMVALQARRLSQHYALLLGIVVVPLLVLILVLGGSQLARQRELLLDGLAAAVEAESRDLTPLATVGDGSLLVEQLRGGEWRAGAAWIVDRRTGAVLPGGERGALPQALAGLPPAELAEPALGFRSLRGHLVMTRALGYAPFTLLYAIPEGELRRLVLGHAVPYWLILVGLLATVLAAQFVLERRFIRPALALVRHIDALGRDQATACPRVPRLWRPWLDAVGETFARNREFQARLAASEATLKAAAESIPEGLAIFDAAGRLAFYNSHYPEHLPESARATMALGRSRAEWRRAAEASGPIYHPDWMQGGDPTDGERHLADGRWLRVRMRPMPDGGHVVLTSDVTADRERREQLMLLETAVAQASDAVQIAGSDHRLRYVNPAFTRLTGYAPEEVIGHTPAEILRSDAHDAAYFATIETTLREGRTWAGRLVSRCKDGHLVHQDARVSPLRDEAGHITHHVAVLRDLTDRIRAEQALEESRRTHEAVLAAALDCFVSIDETGRIIAFNPAAERTFGYTQAEAIGQPLDRLLVPERHRDAHRAGLARHLATGTSRILGRRVEVTAICKDGREIPVEVVVVATRHGDRQAFAAYMRDLSEQKRAEAALRASEARFLAAAESIPDGLMILDAEDRIVFHNSRHPELLPPILRESLRLGVRFEDWVREALAKGSVYHPDMGPAYAAMRLESRRGDPQSEREHKHADGRWVRVREGRMPDGGRVILTTDVTARREAEERSRASEARFLAAAESIPDGLAIFDADGRFVYFNSRYPEHVSEHLRPSLRLGVRFEDWIREGLARGPIYHPDMGTDFPARRFALHGQERAEHEQKLMDGRWLRLRESRMADGGRVLLTTDVTERHRREQELTLLAMAVEQVGDPVEITDADGRFTYVNPAFTRVTGYGPAEVIGREPQEVLHSGYHPEAFFVAMEEQLDQGRSWHGTIVNRRKNGELVHQDTMISPLRDEAGHIHHYVAVKRDVTEQERAEAALRESEARYRALVETQTEFVVRQTTEGRLSFVNEAYCRYLGLPREAILGRSWDDFAAMVPEDRIDLAAHIARLSPDRPSEPIEIRVVLHDGSEHLEHWVDTGVFDAEGRVVEIQAVGRDVTEQKQAELALKESEARYRAVVEGQSEFILRVRPDGTLSFVNDAYCRYRGLTREALLGGFNDVYHYPPEQQAKIHAAWASLSPEFPSVTYALVEPVPGGGERWEEWTDTAVFAPNGRVIEYQAIGRDVTERKRAEQALKESEQRFRMIAEGVPLPIAITALDEHRVLFANAKAREVFGVETGAKTREEVEGIWADPAQRYELARRIRAEGSVEQAEVRMRRRDGTAFDALLSARPMRYAGCRAVLGVVIDITERRRMEEALRASEARLTALMDHAPLVVHLKDREGRYLLANSESAKIFGCEPAAMIGRTPRDVFPPEEAAMIERHHQEVLETGGVVVHEEHQPSLDAYRWSIVIRFPIRDASGAVAIVGGFALDITERKRAEAALKASEQRFRTIADLHPTPMVVATLDDRRVLFANRAHREVFGPPDHGLDAAFSCAEPGLEDKIFAAVGRGEPVEGREVMMCAAGGAAFPSMLTARGIDYEGARCCVMSFLDLTALKRAEAALRASEQRFRSIAEAHPMPLVIVRRADGRFLFANTPFRRLFGLGDAPLDGLRPEELYAEPADRQCFLELIREKGGVDALEQNLRRRDGTVFPAAATSRVIDYEGDRAFVTSVVDLTERKAAEAEIQRQREALHQSEKLTALGSLLAGVAHELNNPLSVVVGYASMLKELAPDDATRTRAERVHAAAERCARIVKTFLAMARSRPPQKGPVALGEVVEAALELSAYGLRTAGVEVVREMAPGLPAVWGDSDQLHQVFTNLIVNAQQALLHRGPPRRLVVRSRCEGGFVTIEVEDNGPGIPEEVKKRIFEPFFTTKPQGVGTGVGLSVCHGIVAAHDGRITVESSPGEGTRFTVLLPLTTERPVSEAQAPDPESQSRGRVLVVDDEKEIAELVAIHLRRDGLAVEIVASGREALARLERGGFDLVVTDLRMPDVDGAALIGALQRQHPELAARMLVITGDALGAGVNEVVRRAGIRVLEKPLDLAALRTEVRRMLEPA
jgi:PAS domain S-box-containing protein